MQTLKVYCNGNGGHFIVTFQPETLCHNYEKKETGALHLITASEGGSGCSAQKTNIPRDPPKWKKQNQKIKGKTGSVIFHFILSFGTRPSSEQLSSELRHNCNKTT